MNKKYNALIIGCGAQGCGVGQKKVEGKIINFAHALTEYEGFEKRGFYDEDNTKSLNSAHKWDGYWITSFWLWQDDYDNPINDYDIAIITTPDDSHYEVLKQLAEYPLKLVICEKPICDNLKQAREIVELYKAKGIPLMVNYTRRFLPYYDRLKPWGKPHFATCQFNKGWIHTATHAIDFFHMLGLESKDYRIKELQYEGRFWRISLDYLDEEGNYHTFTEERIGTDKVWDYYDKSHYHVIDNAYQFLEGKEEIKCTGEDALKALEICYELMEGKK